ncbi:alpha/beta-hydrolase [Coprinopsis marcescibilis]|uniref:Alpha/beta-hydrolase n=1 Tax=Coprinopsis marcescibilis TaxID=230819 RepID=A0A5C3KR15_COPMA|nr:alpha/beta-hydrolase [Coprinopsis marcescibilis]
MYRLNLFITLAVTASVSVATTSQPNCITTLLPVRVNATNKDLNIEAPKSQDELTGFATRFTSLNSNVTTDVIKGDITNNATYNIWTKLCIPQTQDAHKTVELAVHGIGFDHTYWTFGGPGSKYNYVDAALASGHAILVYDRLGVGLSDKPDGIKEVQTATEVEIAAQLGLHLKSRPSGQQFNRVVAVGHSYGSVQLIGVASNHGNLFDATVLTGFAPFSGGFLSAFSGFGMTIAAIQEPKRFGSLHSSYLATANIVADQQLFFRFPNFDPAVLRASEATKQTATLGELITQGASVAANYTNPVFALTGDKDYIFCGGDCYQKVDGSANLIEPVKFLFPGVTNFAFNIPAETGHGINFHLNAQESFSQIQSFINSL